MSKSVVVSASGFTPSAKNWAGSTRLIELIGRVELIRLLNYHMGANWPREVDRIISESIHRNKTRRRLEEAVTRLRA